MLLPSIFGEDLFDDWMDFPFDDKFEKKLNKELYGRKNPVFGKNAARIMRTDVKEKKDSYEVDVDLPGFKKDQIRVELENGYLTISATKGANNDEQNKEGKYIRRERYTGTMSRSFYVGEDVQQEDIHAKFEDGILKLTVPKEDPKKVEEKKYISIEG